MSPTPTNSNAQPPSFPEGSVGYAQTQFVRIEVPLTLSCGRTLESFQIAYETYGNLNETRSNAVFICHALTGDAHVAGYHEHQDPSDPRCKPGWWDMFIGPGKAIDTDRYFVICSNVLGGCSGTSGPTSEDGHEFPLVTIGDMVEVQKRLVDHLGIEKLLCVIGGSMGGMQALEWAVRFPDMSEGVIPIATTACLTAQSLSFDAVGRNAIKSDPEFHDGHYEKHGTTPKNGLAIARMLAHITYLSEESMASKFGRTLRDAEEYTYEFDSEFSVETYLDHQGTKFVERFDANSYMYLTKAMDYFDLGAERGGLTEAIRQTKARFLLVSFRSDWLFSAAQSQEIVRSLLETGKTVSYINVDSPYGHDAFLLERGALERLIGGFLAHLDQSQTGDHVHLPVTTKQDRKASSIDRRIDLEKIKSIMGPEASILDLGCGDGLFLQHLRANGWTRLQGVELDQEEAIRCVERGVDVIQSDLDEPLSDFVDSSFDYVLLSRTLQTVRRPEVVLNEVLRIGDRAIVSFPNFSYWRNRLSIAFGRTPVTRNLPFSWVNTPNLHYLTMEDFEQWAKANNVVIHKRMGLDYESDAEIRWMSHLRATDAIYVISLD